MTDNQAEPSSRPNRPEGLLGQVRESLGMSLTQFTAALSLRGGPNLTRQRLSQFERGDRDMPALLWPTTLGALRAMGAADSDLDALGQAVAASTSLIDSLPPSTPAVRRARWTTLAEYLAHHPQRAHFHAAAAAMGINLREQHAETLRRLNLGAEAGSTWTTDPADAVEVVLQASSLETRAERHEQFIVRLQLRNTGRTHWRDRLLYRLGPPVTSSLPLTPGVLPLPDADPGVAVDVLIPARAQWFINRAVVSYTMVFPDLTPCLPGHLQLVVDTRDVSRPDTTFPLPPGFTAWLRRFR